MRSEVPNPFGTSLIDLLVGALAIVALLWVLAAPNSGYRGLGEEDRTSGMVAVEQFGWPHLVSVHLTQPGRFDVEYRLNYPEEANAYMELVNSTSTAIVTETLTPFPNAAPTVTSRAVYEILPLGLDEPVKVTLRLVAPEGGFFKGLHISVEKLDSLPLIARIGIEPCCSAYQPHYLRMMSMSGNGEREILTFWQEAGLLQRVLTQGYPLDAGEPSDDWIQHFAERLRDGQDIRLRSFHVLPTLRLYGAVSNAVEQCMDARTATTLTVRFEPDGDISFRPPDSNETPSAPAQGEPDYRAFAASYPTLLENFPDLVR